MSEVYLRPGTSVHATPAAQQDQGLYPKDRVTGAKIKPRKFELAINHAIHQKTLPSARKIHGSTIFGALELRNRKASALVVRVVCGCKVRK